MPEFLLLIAPFYWGRVTPILKFAGNLWGLGLNSDAKLSMSNQVT